MFRVSSAEYLNTVRGWPVSIRDRLLSLRCLTSLLIALATCLMLYKGASREPR